jgi:type II restriction/modification system DNA methylase subunit YeeA
VNAHQFAAKWKAVTLKETAAYAEHFNGLCALLGEKTPAEADPAGTFFTFQKGVTKAGGGKGFADVWRRGCFGWEYKGKHKDLRAAYDQLLQYREALENPPLLVVCDLNTFVIRTNFTGFPTRKHEFDLDGLAADPKNLDLLRRAFADPYSLKPDLSQEQVTAGIADRFSKLADGMRGRGVPPDAAAHFLMKLMFCMFAEDIGLLPRDLFTRTVANSVAQPARLSKLLGNLFASMNAGEPFGADDVYRFNGRLFEDAEVVDLTAAEAAELLACARCDWSAVEPSIFGTLFERCLDPAKRGQLGAHYTGRADIETLLKPVLLDPLRREWDAARAEAEAQWERSKRVKTGEKAWQDARAQFDGIVRAFLHRLSGVTVLDPACGSGNFLYVALNMLLDLEKEVITWAAERDQYLRLPAVRPTQLRGLEVNVYARELAQVVIWIGFHQWMRFNGFVPPTDPVLAPMDSIRWQDAVLNRSDPENVRETEWPDAEFIVGNPPFLGYSPLRANLGHEYVETLFEMYRGRVSNQSDLCVYWFEKARAMIEQGRAKRAGLLATQAIRGGKNREVLNRIKQTGDIFFAVSDRDWVLDGAAVHISMVGFDDGTETSRVLDGKPVSTIHANLTADTDVTAARRLVANLGLGFIGGFKFGSFDIPEPDAIKLVNTPSVGGRPTSDVVRPWFNGLDILRRRPGIWVIDYGVETTEDAASLYDAPFGYIREHVKPERDAMRREGRRQRWWLHGETARALRSAAAPLSRLLLTPRVAKHRVFAWAPTVVCVDGQLVAFAREDDYFFGVLHSRIHEVWARSQGTQVRERESGFRYTPTTCFETFPFPEPTDAQREAVAAAARKLDELRANWLNPPEWTKTEVLEFPGSADGPWRRYVTDADPARGVGTVRYPRVVPRDAASAAQLKKRTLTNLYNDRPAWLAAAHRKLDEAVFAAYGWPADLPDDDLLARLLALNLSRAGTAAPPAADPDPDDAP